MAKILLIDDDEELAEPLRQYFLKFDLQLVNETHPNCGLRRLEKDNYDLLILDLMLPDLDGFELCKLIRKTSDIPIIMLTARGDVMDRVVGLEIGADDYLPKPFEPRELVARVQNVLKRVGPQHQNATLLCFGELQIDLKRQHVSIGQHLVKLTTMEYQLLVLLARSPGENFTRDDILNALKGIDTEIYSRSVDILVSRLRHKLKPLEFIKTVWGSGYTFIP